MFGVRFTRDPYALMAWAAWSSDMMKMMFGRAADPAGSNAAQTSSPIDSAIHVNRMRPPGRVYRRFGADATLYLTSY